MFPILTFKRAMCRVQSALFILHLRRVHTAQGVQIYYLPQLLSEIFGSKVVNEGVEAAIQAAQAERQFVGLVGRLLIEESQNSVSHQEDVVGRKAEGEDHENNDGQTYRSLFLGRLGIAGQFAYDSDVAKYCDTEREEEEEEHHAEEEGRPGCLVRKHVFLQHVEACGNVKFRNIKGQVRGHQRVQDTQDHTPHEEAADDSHGLPLPDLSEQHGPDDAQVAVDSDGHHGQDGAVHVGVEDECQETIGGDMEEEGVITG